MASTPGALVQSPWHTKQIALRHDFVLNKTSLMVWFFLIHHDEDALVFLNGIQVAAFDGFGTDYIDIQLPRPHWMLWLWARTPWRSSVASPLVGNTSMLA